MGDMAEAILDGLFCMDCGCVIDGEETGYPRSCCVVDDRPKQKPKKAIKKSRLKKEWGPAAEKIKAVADKWCLTIEWRNPDHPFYEIAFLRGDGVRLCVYPHKTTAGNRHARIRDMSSPDKLRARTIMLASGLTIKAGGLPEGE